MFIKNLLTVIITTVCLLALSSSAIACACCAERGTYSVGDTAIDSHYLGMMKDINFDTIAELYTTAAGFDDIRGLGSIAKEYECGQWDDFNLVDAFTKNAWHLTFKSPGGKSGTLVLPKPARVTIFKVDRHDDSATKQAMVVLYKEFRFRDAVRSGSGIFRDSIGKRATYSLVFQGKGNECDSSSDFTHWRIEVSGSKAKYAFFGKVVSAG